MRHTTLRSIHSWARAFTTSDAASEQRLLELRRDTATALAHHPNGNLWLFGSWARGDWDGYSDVDVLAIAPNREAATGLAEAVLDLGMADDVLALTEQEWMERRHGTDPYWRAIGRDALPLSSP